LLLIRGTLKFAKQLGYQVSEITYPQIKLPKSPLRYLSDDEERRLLAALDPMRQGAGLSLVADRSPEMQRALQDAYDLVILLLDTGARYSEVANIEWSRIDLAERAIHLWRSKVQNETILYMSDRCSKCCYVGQQKPTAASFSIIVMAVRVVTVLRQYAKRFYGLDYRMSECIRYDIPMPLD